MENCVKCVLEKYCENKEGYIVTGAKPSPDKKLKNGINIPLMLWSAFCCYSHKKNKWIASAHWGDNVPDKSPTKYPQTNTLQKLYDILSIWDRRCKAFP